MNIVDSCVLVKNTYKMAFARMQLVLVSYFKNWKNWQRAAQEDLSTASLKRY
jgi:hypothetical protein